MKTKLLEKERFNKRAGKVTPVVRIVSRADGFMAYLKIETCLLEVFPVNSPYLLPEWKKVKNLNGEAIKFFFYTTAGMN